MTTVLDYTAAAAALDDSYFLGQVVSFTISDKDIGLDDAHASLAALNLRTGTLKTRLRPIDAFKKAANEIATKFDRDAHEQHSILVRPVGQDSESSHRHVVLERAIFKVGARRRVEHETIWTLVYDRGVRQKDGTIADDQIEARPTPAGLDTTRLSAAEQAWLAAHIGPDGSSLINRYEHWCTHLDSHTVRTFVREYITRVLGGIPVKANAGGGGGLYFVSQKHVAELRDLMTWVKQIGSAMHLIPLLDIVDQREMLVEAFANETMDEIRSVTGEMNKILTNPTRQISERIYDEFVERAAALIGKHQEYSGLLGDSMDTAKNEIDLFRMQTLTLASRIRKPKSLSIKATP